MGFSDSPHINITHIVLTLINLYYRQSHNLYVLIRIKYRPGKVYSNLIG